MNDVSFVASLPAGATPRPTVSVIVANYNGARFIEAALRSALGQTLHSLEVIVADDGSTDDSRDRVVALAAQDSRLLLLPPAPTARSGPGATRNRCLAVARGDWIAVLDSDDLMHPERLAELVAAAARDGADIVADDLLMFDQDPTIVPRACLGGRESAEPRWIGLAEYIAANTMFRRRPALGYLKPVIRAAVLRADGMRYDPSLRIGEDYDLVARLLERGARFRVYPELRYFYRRHAASVSHRLAASDITAMLQANARAASPSDPAAARALAERAAMLQRALAFDTLILAIKRRDWRATLSVVMREPLAALLLRQPLTAALRRMRQAPHAAAVSHRPQAVVISRQRVVGGTSGSSRYLLDLVDTVAACGVTPHLVAPSPAIFGRSPILHLGPEMNVFASIAVRGGLRAGRWLIATTPGIWLGAARGIAGALLGRIGIAVPALTRPAPYSVAVPWSRADQLFVASHARPHGDLIIADYAFVTPAVSYVLRPEAASLVVMHDLFSSRPGQFDAIGAADSVAALDLRREMQLLALADAIIAIQPEEAGVVRGELPGHTVLVAPIAVQPVAAPQPGTTQEVLFVGTKAAPNVIGLRRFLDDAWPAIIAAQPQAKLTICGQAGAAVGPLPDGATALGYVADLGPLYSRAAVVVVPLPAGSGLKIKLVEALGHGKAVVASAAALQGVPPDAVAAVWPADAAADTAHAVITLLRDDALRGRYAAAALRAAGDNYGVEASHRSLRRFVEDAVGHVGPGPRTRAAASEPRLDAGHGPWAAANSIGLADQPVETS